MQSSAAISDKITEEVIFSMASVAKPKEIKEKIENGIKTVEGIDEIFSVSVEGI